MKTFNRVNEKDLAYFSELAPGRVFSGEAISTDYDHDEMTEYGHYMPEAVIQALSTEDVSAVLKYCNERNIAVTPRGSGTGLCGGCVAIHGGVVLSTEKMKRVLEVDRRNMTATVEPGVLLMEFPKALEGTGLFYPPDPGEKTAMANISGFMLQLTAKVSIIVFVFCPAKLTIRTTNPNICLSGAFRNGHLRHR